MGISFFRDGDIVRNRFDAELNNGVWVGHLRHLTDPC